MVVRGEAIPGIVDARPIGSGGFGQVFRARQPAFDRDVAVKVLSGKVDDEDTARRFRRECRLLGSLGGHPNIVALHDAGVTASGSPYLVMPFLARGSLAAELERRGRLPWQRVVPWGVKLAGALHTAHRAGVLHRDLKPGNILMSDYGDPLLADFGIALGLDDTAGRTTATALTPAFSAPELLSRGVPTVASDVYGLAATLFTLLAGHGPFTLTGERAVDDSLVAMMARIALEPPPDLRPFGVPDPVARVLEAALAKEPAARPPDAFAFGRALADAGAALGLPVAAVPLPEDTEQPPVPQPVPQPAVPQQPPVPVQVPVPLPQGPMPQGPMPQGPVSRRALVVGASTAAVLALGGGSALFAVLRERSPRSTTGIRPTGSSGASGAAASSGPPGSASPSTAAGASATAGSTGPLPASASGSGLSPVTPPATITRAAQVWQPSTGDYVSQVRFTPDGGRLAVLDTSSTLTLRAVPDGAATVTIKGRTDDITAFDLGPGVRTVATGGFGGAARIRDAATGTVLWSMPGHKNQIFGVSYNADGTLLASADFGGAVRLWNPANGRAVRVLNSPSGVYQAVFRPGTPQVAGTCYDDVVRVWDAGTGKLVATFTGHTQPVYTADFSPDGRLVATGSWDETVWIRDAGSGARRHVLTGHRTKVEQVAFSPDGRLLATISAEPRIRLWDVASGTVVSTLTGHTAALLAVAWSPDGTRLASGGLDGTVRLWSLAGG